MRKLHRRGVAAPFLLALALQAPAVPAATVFGVGTSATADAEATGEPREACDQSWLVGRATTGCSAAITSSDGSASTQITVDAALNDLGAVATATAAHSDASGVPTGAGANSSGMAKFWDQITIHSPAALSGSLEFSLALVGDGTVGIYNRATSSLGFDVTFFGTQGFGETGNAHYKRDKLLDIAGVHEVTTDDWGNWPHPRVPFTLYYDSAAGEWTRTVYFSLLLDVSASCGASFDYSTEDASESCDAAASYGDGLKVTGIRTLDGDGNPVANATLTSDSGTDYHAPEPASFAEIGSALLVLVWKSRRRASRARRGRDDAGGVGP